MLEFVLFMRSIQESSYFDCNPYKLRLGVWRLVLCVNILISSGYWALISVLVLLCTLSIWCTADVTCELCYVQYVHHTSHQIQTTFLNHRAFAVNMADPGIVMSYLLPIRAFPFLLMCTKWLTFCYICFHARFLGFLS